MPNSEKPQQKCHIIVLDLRKYHGCGSWVADDTSSASFVHMHQLSLAEGEKRMNAQTDGLNTDSECHFQFLRKGIV